MTGKTVAFHLHPDHDPAARAADNTNRLVGAEWATGVTRADIALDYMTRGRAFLDVEVTDDTTRGDRWYVATLTVVFRGTDVRLSAPGPAARNVESAVEQAEGTARTLVEWAVSEVARFG